MDIQSLRILKAAADTGSFSAAARELNYAQSHVSTQILHLEHEIGAPLFYRHNRGISLTPTGEVFVRYANEMSRIMTEANKAIEENDKPAGTIRIASMQTCAQTLLPSLLSEYHKKYPDVRLEIRTGTSSKNVQAVLNYEADLGFVAGDYTHSSLGVKTIDDEKLVLLGANLSPKIHSAAELEGKTLLVLPEGCAYKRRMENWLSAEGYTPNDEIVFDSIAGILAAACTGLGVALLPEKAAEPLKEKGFLTTCEIPPEFNLIKLTVIYRKDQYLSAALSKMLEML